MNEIKETYMNEEEIMALMPSDFRDLTQEEEMRDNFRRMFQIEIRNKLETASGYQFTSFEGVVVTAPAGAFKIPAILSTERRPEHRASCLGFSPLLP